MMNVVTCSWQLVMYVTWSFVGCVFVVMRGRPGRFYHLSDININSGGGGGDEFVERVES